jgi:hypothetical protein
MAQEKRKKGSPISRQVKRHRPSLGISLIPFPCSRGSLTFCYAPLFSIMRRRIAGPAPVTHRVQGCGAIRMRKSSPAPGKFTCPRKLSVPRRVQGFRDKLPPGRTSAKSERSVERLERLARIHKGLYSCCSAARIQDRLGKRNSGKSRAWLSPSHSDLLL